MIKNSAIPHLRTYGTRIVSGVDRQLCDAAKDCVRMRRCVGNVGIRDSSVGGYVGVRRSPNRLVRVIRPASSILSARPLSASQDGPTACDLSESVRPYVLREKGR